MIATKNVHQQQKVYNKYFREYDKEMAQTHLMNNMVFNSWKTQCSNKNILDVGCGNAYVLNELNKADIKFHSYTGIDISDAMIAENSKQHHAQNNVHFLMDDAEKLASVKNKKFDIIISYGCLHHLEHPETSIGQIYNNLKQNGKFFALEVNRNHPAGTFIGFYSYLFGINPEKINAYYSKILNKICGQKTQSDYRNNHPGHPGKRTPDEYRNIINKYQFQKTVVRSFYLEMLPYPLYRSSMLLFKIMVHCSRIFLKLSKFRDVGNLTIIECTK